MPAFVTPLIGFALGALLAWFNTAAQRRPSSLRASDAAAAKILLRGRPLTLAALFGVLVFTPVCAYFLIFAPDWSFAYLVDARRIPSAVDLLLLLLDAASVPAGFIAARGSLRTTAVLAGTPLAVALLAVLLLAPRLSVDGTYRQVVGDFGIRPVAGGPLGYALLWMHMMLVAGFMITVRALLARDAPAPHRPVSHRADRATPDATEPPRSPPPARPPPPATSESLPPRRLGVGRNTLSGRPDRRT